MSEFQIQGRSRIHQGHAPVIELQGVYVSRSQARRRRSLEPERGASTGYPCMLYLHMLKRPRP